MSVNAPALAETIVATAPVADVDDDFIKPSRWRGAFAKVLLVFSFAWLIAFVVLAIVADLLPLEDPGVRVDSIAARAKPFTAFPEFLGTDRLGRSVLSRVIYGSRISLTVGLASAALAMVVGGTIGMLAGYRRRRTDAIVGTFTDAALAFPPLVFLLALAAARGPGWSSMIIGLAVIGTPTFIRLSRANSIRYSQEEFVMAARVVGARDRSIVFRELLPNVLPPVAAYALLIVAVLITAEASLSFLGLGVPPPTPSWGVMISDGRQDLSKHPHLVFVPCVILFITIFAVNTVGDWARGKANGTESRV
jgi:peptide/nickel transport system permease protein